MNLVVAEDHSSEVMDTSFANQFLAVKYLYENKGKLPPSVLRISRELDEEVAKLKLESMWLEIDSLTSQQREYLSTWEHGSMINRYVSELNLIVSALFTMF